MSVKSRPTTEERYPCSTFLVIALNMLSLRNSICYFISN